VTRAVALPAAAGADAEGRVGRVRAWVPALIPAGYLVLAFVMTWRLWAHPSSATVAGNPSDTSQFTWYLRYEATAIIHGRMPSLMTTAMNAPQGISMLWNTTLLLPGILLTPLTVLAGPQASLTVLLTLGFAGSAASLYYVLRRHGASLAAAAFGGAVYGFSPALTHAAIGHYQLQFAVLPPLIIDAVLRLCQGPARPVLTGAWLGLLITAQLFTSEELLAITAIAAAVIVAVLALSRPRAVAAALRPVATGLAVAGALVLVVAGWALRAQFFGPLRETGSAFTPDFFKNDLYSFITPSGYQLIHTTATAATAARYQGGAPEYLAYLGAPLILVLGLAAILFWRHLPVRVCAVTTVVLALLSLGVHPLVNGTVHPGVTLPWWLLARLPVLVALLPDRFALLTAGAAGALLAFSIDLARSRLDQAQGEAWSAGLVAVVAGLAVVPLLPAPLPSTPAVALPAGWSATFRALHLRAGARVLVVPVPTPEQDEALRWQAQSAEPISLIGGYFEGPAWNGHAYIDGNGLPSLAYYVDGLWQRRPAVPPPTQAQISADLAYWKPQAVVADAAREPALRAYLERIFGPPAVTDASMLGWKLPHHRPAQVTGR
jgi:hypothetical protein